MESKILLDENYRRIAERRIIGAHEEDNTVLTVREISKEGERIVYIEKDFISKGVTCRGSISEHFLYKNNIKFEVNVFVLTIYEKSCDKVSLDLLEKNIEEFCNDAMIGKR